nr:unnamed protein product [Callosobruchus analis]
MADETMYLVANPQLVVIFRYFHDGEPLVTRATLPALHDIPLPNVSIDVFVIKRVSKQFMICGNATKQRGYHQVMIEPARRYLMGICAVTEICLWVGRSVYVGCHDASSVRYPHCVLGKCIRKNNAMAVVILEDPAWHIGFAIAATEPCTVSHQPPRRRCPAPWLPLDGQPFPVTMPNGITLTYEDRQTATLFAPHHLICKHLQGLRFIVLLGPAFKTSALVEEMTQSSYHFIRKKSKKYQTLLASQSQSQMSNTVAQRKRSYRFSIDGLIIG